MRNFGTIVTNVLSAENGDSPVKNWKGAGYKDFAIPAHSGNLDAQLIIDRQARKYHCFSWAVGCGGICRITTGRYLLEETHKPEYETCCAFGALILNNDLDSIFKINEMLNRAGMDTISAGSSVAFAMECYENGILTRKDRDGVDLRWGNADAVIDLLEKMIRREGLQTPKHFKMNPRGAGQPPLTVGPLKGIKLDRDRLKGDFLRAMQWDAKSGAPSKKKLDELGLQRIARDLHG